VKETQKQKEIRTAFYTAAAAAYVLFAFGLGYEAGKKDGSLLVIRAGE
jgi:hypothetical protein